MTLRRFLMFTALPCALFLAPAAARADNAPLPDIIAPWMEAHGLLMDAPDAMDAESGGKEKAGTLKAPPRAPVITPRRTMEILQKLAQDAGAEDILPSPLEESYARRIVDNVSQFGYDMFGTAEKHEGAEDKNRNALPSGAVQDDFVLSIGDRLDITFRGQRRDRATYAITNQGMLVIDDLPPVTAAGRTIAQLREALAAELDSMHNTQVFVALDAVRQIDILVVGHVKTPGRQTLTVFHTVLDALSEAGGVQKTGSLRQIKLVRGGRSTVIDLYGLLVHGSDNMDLALQDGDRIIVPPIGPTVAVAGGVKRPGIYEILPALKGMLHKPGETSRLSSLEDLLELGGGVLSPGQNRFMKLGLSGDGRETASEIADAYAPVFGDGAILMVSPSDDMRAGTVELAGHTRRPGLHALDKTPTLSALIGDEKTFGPDIYPLVGAIERWNGNQLSHQILPFPPLLVLQGKFDRKLEDGDIVHLFSRKEIMSLQNAADGKEEIEEGSFEADTEDAVIEDEIMASFLRERFVFVRGAVRTPGGWPVAEGVSLENIIAVSGGMTLEANTGNIEVTSALGGEDGQAHGRSGTQRLAVSYAETDPATVMLEPGDAVRVNQKFLKVDETSVLIIGEVARPGRYDLMPGDRLSDLLARAGGLTAQSYADGAIFSRESARKAEEQRFRAAARDLEQSLAAQMENRENAPDSGQLAMARDLAAQLRQVQAVGRITVEADPGVLAVQPELDILLESGDRIYIPRRPLTVKVDGEVLSPAALQFRSGKDPRSYIDQAGGFTYHADKDRVFVLYPDGSAQPLQVNAWNHSPAMIPPGSTIVVPRDPKPFDFLQTAKDISQLLSNLAITGIFLDDIRDN